MTSENPVPEFDIHPALVLGAYGEELASGARVAVFGSATLGLAEELLLRGARLVHVYDPDAGRVAEATAQRRDRSIFFGALPDSGDVGVRDGAFDLVIVPDLSIAADPEALVGLVRRVLAPAGATLIASPNTDATAPLIPLPETRPALGYYELYEAVAAHFSSVRMLGQAPFVGYAVAEFSVEDPEPTIDTSLAESDGKEPDWFIVLASDRNIRLDAFALIELPKVARAAAAHEPRFVKGSVPAPAAQPSTQTTGTVLVNILEAEREAALDSLRQHEQILKEERFRADQSAADLGALREEMAITREKCRAAEKRANDEEALRTALEEELERARRNPELAALRDRVLKLDASSESLAAEHEADVARLKAQLRDRGNESESLTAEHEADVARLEAQLRDRGHEIMALGAEVARREKLVRELVATNFPSLPIAPAAPATSPSNGHEGVIADLSARLDRLAGEAATREADLQAAKWKIAQLERERAEQR